MGTIFFSIIKSIARVNLLYFAIAITTALVARQTGFNELVWAIGIILLITVIFGPIETSRRVPMLLSFPFSRNRLIALCGFINVMAATMTASMLTLYYYILYILDVKTFPVNLLQVFFRDAGPDTTSDFFQSSNLKMVVTLLTILSFGILYTFATSNSQNMGQLNRAAFPNREKKAQVKILGIVYTALGILVFISFLSSYLFTALTLVGLNLITAEIVSNTWVFSRKRRFKWLLSFFAIGLIQISVLYLSVHRTINSEKISEKLYGVEYLGFLGPKIDKAFIQKIVSTPLSPADGKRLVELIAPREKLGEIRWYALNATKAKVPFRELLAHQSDEETIHQFVSLYNPRTMTVDDLEFVMNLEKLLKDDLNWKILPGQSAWLTLQLEDQFVRGLMGASEPYKNRFAVLYTEFHSKKEFIDPLSFSLRAKFPGYLIPAGIQALSVQLGKKLDLRSYLDVVAKGGQRKYLEIDCSKYDLRALLSLDDATKENDFNRCIRKLAVERKNAYAVSQIYKWYSLPLSAFDKRYLNNSFQKKN